MQTISDVCAADFVEYFVFLARISQMKFQIGLKFSTNKLFSIKVTYSVNTHHPKHCEATKKDRKEQFLLTHLS